MKNEETRVRVLTVEDSPTQSELLRHMLEGNGYSVTIATHGKEALELLEGSPVELVISDILTPIMDGYELCRSIKEDPALKNILVILSTSLTGPSDIIKCLESGADSFLAKPYDEGYLISCIRSVLRNEELRMRSAPEEGLTINFANEEFCITSDRRHILNFFLSTYGIAVQKNLELVSTQHKLSKANEYLERAVERLKQTAGVAEKRKEALEEANRTLKERVDEAVAECHMKDMVMMHQSRMAAMGEMIGNIAHQWRQPLNALNLLLANVEDAYAHNELDGDALRQRMDRGRLLIKKMSTTIDDFRNFFRPERDKERFSLAESVREAAGLLDASFESNNISISVEVEKPAEAVGFPNEYSQVVLNLLSNARDAITERRAEGGAVTVRVGVDGPNGVVSVRDNGGGIPPEVIGRIFDVYFSTKDEGKGTGLGLYMSKVIIEGHMGGRIEAFNSGEGAEFRITTPLPVD